MTSFPTFVSRADDNVLGFVCKNLQAIDLLNLALASTASRRLHSQGTDDLSTESERRELSGVLIFLSEELGSDAAAEACRASGELPALAALASHGAAGTMLRRLLLLLQQPENAIDDTLRFLDAAFCAEAFWTSQARVGAAAEAAISVLLRRSTEEI